MYVLKAASLLQHNWLGPLFQTTASSLPEMFPPPLLCHLLPPAACHLLLQNVAILPTEGPRPVVYADFLHAPPGAPTALIYGAAGPPLLPLAQPAVHLTECALPLLPAAPTHLPTRRTRPPITLCRALRRAACRRHSRPMGFCPLPARDSRGAGVGPRRQ
jgi:hypothetical protein